MQFIKDVINIEIKEGKKANIFKLLIILLFNPSRNAVLKYRIAKLLYNRGYKRIAKLISISLIKRYGLHISLKSEIGLGLKLKHINGVVIGDGVILGKNTSIYQQVTLGGQNLGDGELGNYPKVGNNVTFFAGCKILGAIVIGDNSIIGANSVVVKDVEENGVYAGVPARKIN